MTLLAATPPLPPKHKCAAESGRLVTLTTQPRPGEGISDLCRRFSRQILDSAAAPLHLLIFGDCRASSPVTAALAKELGGFDWPITWVEGAACGTGPIAGLQAHAFTGPVERLISNGRVVASTFTDGGARQCVVGGLGATGQEHPRPEQTRRALEDLAAILMAAGFDLADVVRTWFFLNEILAWYGQFNAARTEIYSGVKFRTGSLPASTGVGARNPGGTALAAVAWAFRPAGKNAYAEEVASPRQCPAPAYGSSFSRAMEISTNGGRRLFISGTASIEPGGNTACVGDARRQVALTMDVVEAILRSRGFGFANLASATAYFRRPADAGIFADWLASRNLSRLPCIPAQCDVCRDDLLFELEGEAVSTASAV